MRVTSPGIYQITGIANLSGRSKSMSDATCTARIKTGVGQFKRLAESSARRVFRPTDQGFRLAVLLAPSSEPASYHLDRPIQISGGMSQAEKSGFELRRRKIDP